MGKLVSCADCEHNISKTAKTCPNCGAKNKRRNAPWWAWLLGVFFLFYIVGSIDNNSTGITTNKNATPKLEVQNFSCNVESGYMHIRGTVKNITNVPLKNVQIVGLHNDQHGNTIKHSSAIIEYNPILPGQTSPFHTLDTHNPAITGCAVEFKSALGGTIYTVKNK